MRPTSILTRYAVKAPKPEVQLYKFPSLDQIKSSNLPNNGFGKGNYFIPKSKYNHWPVYLKISNTKQITEIRKIKGDLIQFRSDLLKLIGDDSVKLETTMNTTAGILNIKGNVVKEVKEVLDKYVN
ncbi:conserved hypothetical protein [Candida tropicalis MYA-3404]|uniref:Large ribosomal subunit protein mL49 n=1 Tax=Candida tropicalis (strain ATCC MYA-3404 / T1) TaxID=294747 RepID=C5M9P3_CANTT|nr:conserved hypothetical protein [Candida tropicalis MYA-3404]EER33387.1 conserved hypothetical protein [Candida tropicalis MYA-3404]KAG4407222.1 hypothetical protein JTP64_002757 [Candida tropicalis]MCP8716670.1 mitochondrial large ribosomal subunit protein MRPL49 [Asgard group archaeon]